MAAAGQPGQSSSEDKTTLILIGLIASLTADIESTCDYFPVINGLISGVSWLLFRSLSLTFYPLHSSALQSPLLPGPSDPKFIQARRHEGSQRILLTQDHLFEIRGISQAKRTWKG